MANGIRAQFAGTCAVCGEGWDVGEMIDRMPGNDRGRAHVECLKPHAPPPPPPARRAGRPDVPPRPTPPSTQITYDPQGVFAQVMIDGIDGCIDAISALSEGFQRMRQAMDAYRDDQ